MHVSTGSEKLGEGNIPKHTSDLNKEINQNLEQVSSGYSSVLSLLAANTGIPNHRLVCFQ
jgi:hypothetical protein